MQGAQIPLRDESSQPSFESGRNYREIKPGGWTTGLEEDKITWHSNSKKPRLIGPTVWETEEITGFSNGKYCGFKILVGL